MERLQCFGLIPYPARYRLLAFCGFVPLLVTPKATARLQSKILHASQCSHDATVSIARPYRRQQPTKAKAGQPSPPNAIDRNLDVADDRRVSSASLNEPATATPNTPSTTDGQDKLQDSLAAETPKHAGFDSYADYADEGPGSGVSLCCYRNQLL